MNSFTSDGKMFFHVLKPSETTNIETERPLYDQIVQQEAMELHEPSPAAGAKEEEEDEEEEDKQSLV